jgi:L-amino acid N-acyltransferase YncA
MPFPAAGVRTEPMTGAHATAVLAIYQAGIEEGNATFEARAPDWAAFTAARLPAHRYVATTAGRVAGWVATSAVSGRCVYAGVVEHSVYVHPAARGRGIGRLLLDTLIASTQAAGIWTIQSGIFPENTVSLALHQAAGFRVVGTRERIGRHHGRWRDVVLIERRSPAVLPVRHDWAQQPHAETQPGRAGGHGNGHCPSGSRISGQYADDHETIQRGDADTSSRTRPADGPIPDTARSNSQQSHDRGKYHAGHDPGRHGDRPGPRAAGQQRHRPVRPDHRPPCQRPASGPAGRVRAGELRRDQARSPNSATAARAAASGARPRSRCRR